MIAATVLFLTSTDRDGRPNIMTAMQGGFVSFAPFLLGVSVKTSSYSHRCITETGRFAFSVPPGALAKQLNYCGIVSGRDVDKLEALQLAVTPGPELGLPMVDGCMRYCECRVKEARHYGSHDLFVGERVSEEIRAEVKDDGGNFIVEPHTVPVVSYTGYDFRCLAEKVWDYTTDSQRLLALIEEERREHQGRP